jgi:PIN domain nuclease of toxin-antitoxin system
MKYLLDTHLWLWGLLDPQRISKKCTRALARATEVWLSPISAWEALLLGEAGKLRIKGDPQRWVHDALQKSALLPAQLTMDVAIESRRVGVSHSDPADRFIAATAYVYDLTLVTADERLLACNSIRRLSGVA